MYGSVVSFVTTDVWKLGRICKHFLFIVVNVRYFVAIVVKYIDMHAYVISEKQEYIVKVIKAILGI